MALSIADRLAYNQGVKAATNGHLGIDNPFDPESHRGKVWAKAFYHTRTIMAEREALLRQQGWPIHG